jgi:hypothetical protein
VVWLTQSASDTPVTLLCSYTAINTMRSCISSFLSKLLFSIRSVLAAFLALIVRNVVRMILTERRCQKNALHERSQPTGAQGMVQMVQGHDQAHREQPANAQSL